MAIVLRHVGMHVTGQIRGIIAGEYNIREFIPIIIHL